LSESSLKSRWRFWAGWTVESKLAIVRLTLILTVTLLIVAVSAFEWMRQQDDLRARGKPDASGTTSGDARVPPDQR
jgi:hypothetical protein